MEKENVFQCPTPLYRESPEVNYSPLADQPPPCFVRHNRERLMGQNLQFESALKSIVSSPSNGRPPPADGVVVRELIGRLGSICNSGEISPQYMGVGNNSVAASCYSTPLNSPPLPSFEGNPLLRPTYLAAVVPHPGLAERATRFSCYGGRNYGGLGGQIGLPLTSNLTASGSQMPLQAGPQLKADTRPNLTVRPSRSLMMSDGAESGGARAESPAIEQVINGTETGLRGGSESNSKKRKALPNSKGKNIPPPPSAGDPPAVPELCVEESESNGKRSKSGDTSGVGNDSVKLQAEQQSNATSGDSGLEKGKEKHSKPPEPPKQDYIHVRARRGQATDSHSLAERVRREKISQKMKFLQDLVPGCSKVTGKAVMLDEIINYVQSLHRQVEFLSMKLATVNPGSDFSVDSLLQKDMHQQHGSLPHSLYPLEVSTSAFQYTPQQHQQGISLQNIVTHGLDSHCSLPPLDAADATLCRTQSMQQPPIDGFAHTSSQLGTLWEDDLQSVVEMGCGQIPETALSSQSHHGSVLTAHMKIEL